MKVFANCLRTTLSISSLAIWNKMLTVLLIHLLDSLCVRCILRDECEKVLSASLVNSTWILFA